MRSVLPRILALLLVAFAAPALAQTPPPQTDAQKAFEQGKTAYNLGQFEKAIELWTKAYELKPNAVFLYNIGQAHRQRKDFAKAIYFYKSYLRESPQAANRADVETKIADMQKLLDEQTKTGEGPPSSPLDPNKPEPEQQPPEPEKPQPIKVKPEPEEPADPGKGAKTLKIAGIATGGAGVAMVLVGIVFSLSAKSTQQELEEHVAMGNAWSEELSDKEASGKTKSTLGVVFLSAGAVCVLAGGGLFVWGMMKGKQASREQAGLQILPAVGPGGANVSLRWTF